MLRNTASPLKFETGSTLLLDITEFLTRFRKQMEEDEWDEFKLIWRSREILLEFARNLYSREESIYGTAKNIAGSRKCFLNWLCLGSELDFAVREHLLDNAPEGSVVTEIDLVFDKPHLLIRHHVPRTEDEPGFERYIERCRREGETIHPEVDKQLRFFRSLGSPGAFVLDRRRYRSPID